MEVAKQKLRDEEVEFNWSCCYMQKFRLYETRAKFYMIGRDKSRTYWRVLKIDRLEPSELNITEDSAIFSEIECCDLLRRIHEGNKSTGGLKFVTTCYGIIGFIKFLEPYYMLLITKRRKIGTICGHTIYAITKSEMIPVPHATVRSKMAYSNDENRSLVNSACNCNTSRVHIKRHIRVALRIILCPLYLDEDCVRSYSCSFEFIITFCKEKTVIEHRVLRGFKFYILGFAFVPCMFIYLFSVYRQCRLLELNLPIFLWYFLIVSFEIESILLLSYF